MKKQRLLFVCTLNRERSPTAARLFKNSHDYEARSAGIHPYAETHITQAHIEWADKIFVMSEKEDGHLSYLEKNFDVYNKEIYDVEISDQYYTNDPQLVMRTKEKLALCGITHFE